MNKLFIRLFALLLMSTGVLFTSCDDDDDLEDQKVNVHFSARPLFEGNMNVAQLKGVEAKFIEVRSQDTTVCVLDSRGEGDVRLFKSTYNISIEQNVKDAEGQDVVLALRLENYSIHEEGQQVAGNVISSPKAAVGQNFIFSEIFFNGERNSNKMMHPDQYIVVFNPTTETLYADGLSIAVTQHMSRQDPQMWYDSYYPDKVPVGGFITIPGEGHDHPVAPGDRFVIAFTAIDHSKVEGYDHAVDLSGADYEIYYGPEANDTDNPDVENVLLTENSATSGFFFQPRGYFSPLMFKLANGKQETVNQFLAENTSKAQQFVPADDKKGTPADTIEIDIISVNTVDILDGVQTSDVPQDVKTRVIPTSVDRGKFLVNGCHRQELAIRKAIKVEGTGKVYYQDTNNSSEDFEDVNERKQKGLVQNAFPIGWRNQK